MSQSLKNFENKIFLTSSFEISNCALDNTQMKQFNTSKIVIEKVSAMNLGGHN